MVWGWFGDVLIVICDDEFWLCFVGYNLILFKMIVFVIVGGLVGIGGVFYIV